MFHPRGFFCCHNLLPATKGKSISCVHLQTESRIVSTLVMPADALSFCFCPVRFALLLFEGLLHTYACPHTPSIMWEQAIEHQMLQIRVSCDEEKSTMKYIENTRGHTYLPWKSN